MQAHTHTGINPYEREDIMPEFRFYIATDGLPTLNPRRIEQFVAFTTIEFLNVDWVGGQMLSFATSGTVLAERFRIYLRSKKNPYRVGDA